MPIPRAQAVYALTPETGFIHEIRSDTLAFSRKAQVASSAISMRLSGDGEYLYVLCDRPKRLVRFQTASFRTDLQAPLPAIPVDFDVDPEDKWIAVSFGTERALGFAAAGERALLPLVKTSGDIGKVRFQGNSGQLVVANLSERMLSVYQVRSRRLVVNLPLAVRPDNLCFNADGGQLFITGEGGDAVVVVYPYFTPEVAGTVLAGHAPQPWRPRACAPRRSICSCRIRNRARSVFSISRGSASSRSPRSARNRARSFSRRMTLTRWC